MSRLTREEIFAQASRKLRSDFEELTTIPHNALKGSQAERLIKVFLNNHLPKRFAVGAGFIIDRHNHVSRQTDVVVYDAFSCPVYRASDEAAIFPSNNVAAVVEVKSRLNKDELESAYNNIKETKSLSKTPVPEGLPFLLQTQTLGCLFAFNSSITLSTIADHYHGLLERSGNLGGHIDIIAVLDQGIITFTTKPK